MTAIPPPNYCRWAMPSILCQQKSSALPGKIKENLKCAMKLLIVRQINNGQSKYLVDAKFDDSIQMYIYG